ncbi:putative YDG domain-containing protein [Seiridium cardinale]|uniref:peptidylprolyl isomerase n=1 Tax=Seiridium cardinale TaxID=138064 RepID=A0ABR2Y3E7_9PEZI
MSSVSLSHFVFCAIALRNHLNRCQTARLYPDPISDDSGEVVWDKSALLNMSDSVRAAIRHDECVGPDAGKLSTFLEAVLKDEERRHPTMGFETIEHARLDKLLEEVLQFAELMKAASHATELPLRFRVDVAHCKKLRVIWRHRFREQYMMIDQLRCAVMVKGGRLKEVSFTSAVTYNLGMWQTADSNLVGEVEGNQQFEAGHWWLNIVCAQRDGIVGCPLERATSGRYGITALPLLTGREELVRRDGHHVVKYIREGRSQDMHIPLISQVGRHIRILRGYRLKSIFAPQAGVRYDGLYIIRQYGSKLDEMTDIYRLELTLERVRDQKSMELVERFPKPSQLDDWNLYEKLEGDKIKLTEGDAKYFEWSIQRQEESSSGVRDIRLISTFGLSNLTMAAGKKGKSDSAKGGKGKGNNDTAQSDKAPAKKKKGAQAITARHILCEKHSKREEALAELRATGDWDAVCLKYSIEKGRSGGQLGIKTKGTLQPEFEAVAFAMDTLEEHKIAVDKDKDYMKTYNYGLCKTEFGYHIIRLDAKH